MGFRFWSFRDCRDCRIPPPLSFPFLSLRVDRRQVSVSCFTCSLVLWFVLLPCPVWSGGGSPFVVVPPPPLAGPWWVGFTRVCAKTSLTEAREMGSAAPLRRADALLLFGLVEALETGLLITLGLADAVAGLWCRRLALGPGRAARVDMHRCFTVGWCCSGDDNCGAVLHLRVCNCVCN